jgi:hypothetical protein
MEQTVIFDCCYSGGANREELADLRYKTRAVKAVFDIPANLDQCIWEGLDSDRGSEYELGFGHKGNRSHIFLAACSAKERAAEDLTRKQGVFTHALFSLLEVISTDAITYSELLRQIEMRPG